MEPFLCIIGKIQVPAAVGCNRCRKIGKILDYSFKIY